MQAVNLKGKICTTYFILRNRFKPLISAVLFTERAFNL